jgi:hypothetical protein
VTTTAFGDDMSCAQLSISRTVCVLDIVLALTRRREQSGRMGIQEGAVVGLILLGPAAIFAFGFVVGRRKRRTD